MALPCDSTDLVHFKKRTGTERYEKIFQISVQLHGKAALDKTVNIDTTVQEKKHHLPNRCQTGDKNHQLKELLEMILPIRETRAFDFFRSA